MDIIEEKIIDEEIIDEVPTLDDLKNKDHVELDNCSESNEADDGKMSASQYKKSLKKKVSQFTDEEKSKYNALSQAKKRKKDKVIEEEVLTSKQTDEEDSKKQHLYNQLFCLKQKFPDNTSNIHIDPDMNLKTLEEKKNLILQIITSKNADRVVFQSLLLLCRSSERGLNYFDIDDLDGFSEEINNSEEDIIPILKELIDMGSIDTTFLTPELRLMVILGGAGVRTIEKNRAKKKVLKADVSVVED